jgi:ligand-binding sensor domain-containing protein
MRIGVLILSISLWMRVSFGQSPHFQSYFLLKKNELVKINTILQDRAGFIWIGSNKGLFKFDGSKYIQYTQDDSLPDNNVSALAEDSLDRIWVGHSNGKLAYVEQGGIHPFSPAEGDAAGEISDILFDSRGVLWFSTHNDGIYYFLHQRLYRIDEADGLPDLFIYDLLEDRQGYIWAGTDRGVAIIRLQGTKPYVEVVNEEKGLPDNIVKKLALGQEGRIWMATEDAGLLSYSRHANSFLKAGEGQWEYGSITDFCVDGNQIWIATQKSGLLVYQLKTKFFQVYAAETFSFLSSIRALLKDQEGNIWIGHKAGLVRTYGNFVEFIVPNNQGSNNVLSLTSDKEGSIWYSTPEGLFHRTMDKSSHVTLEKPLQFTPYKDYAVISLYTDTMGYVWAGLYGEGVLRFHPVTGKIQHVRHELRNGNVIHISGKGNTVWLATLGGASEIRLSGESTEVKNYSSKEGLASDFIYQVFIDSKKRVWFATDGKGACCLEQGRFHRYAKGIASKAIYGFAEDARGDIWANVQGEGLYKWKGEAFEPMQKRTQIEENSIDGLVSDKHGNLVTASDFGIEVYNPFKDEHRCLGEEVGIENKMPNLNAIGLDKSGRIYVGTDNGILVYSDPGHHVFTQPKPSIENLSIGMESFLPTDNLRLEHFQNNISIHYTGMWYQNPEHLYFQYKLQNHDQEWVVSRNTFVTYSNLPAGTYVFHLKVSDTGDLKESEETTFQFTVKAPFWHTPWFYVVCVVLSVLLIFTYIKYRERRLKLENELLEKKIQARTLEIRRQNKEIQAQAEEIKGINEHLEEMVKQRTIELERKNKALEEHAFINAHKLRGPVATLLGLIQIQLLGVVSTTEDKDKWSTHLMGAAKKLDDIVRSITEAIEKGD